MIGLFSVGSPQPKLIETALRIEVRGALTFGNGGIPTFLGVVHAAQKIMLGRSGRIRSQGGFQHPDRGIGFTVHKQLVNRIKRRIGRRCRGKRNNKSQR